MTRLLVLLLVPAVAGTQTAVVEPPYYTADSVGNAADNRPDYFAPNALVSIYGKNLSYKTEAASRNGTGSLPQILGDVRVAVAGGRAHLLYVSPNQINIALPSNLVPGMVELRVDRAGVAGPNVRVRIEDTAPAPFQLDGHTIIATHADGKLLTAESPARPGEVIVVYAAGLGHTSPPQNPGSMAAQAAPSLAMPRMQIEVDGRILPPQSLYYAGITPGFVGLYQINMRMPDEFPENPTVRFLIDDRSSMEGLVVPASMN